jgi:hypothetical protein
MAAKTHEEFCKNEHHLTTGHCHIKIECEECKRIWNAAIDAVEGVRERAPNKQSVPLSSVCIGCGSTIDNVYCDDCRRRLSS